MDNLKFKQITAVFHEGTRETNVYGLTDNGSVYFYLGNKEGWMALPMHAYQVPEPEKPISKSMQRHKSDEE